MEGSIAKLPEILDIAREHDAIVVMDDSHATGVLGKTGRGTAEHFGVLGEGYLRLSYANSTENIRKALDRMGEFLSSRKAA